MVMSRYYWFDNTNKPISTSQHVRIRVQLSNQSAIHPCVYKATHSTLTITTQQPYRMMQWIQIIPCHSWSHGPIHTNNNHSISSDNNSTQNQCTDVWNPSNVPRNMLVNIIDWRYNNNHDRDTTTGAQ
eukprot:921672_1